MTTFADMVKTRDAQAAAWLEANAGAMVEERDSAYSNSHECASGTGGTEHGSSRSDPFSMLAALEIGQGYWEDTVEEQSIYEDGGMFDVTAKAAWRGTCTSYENEESKKFRIRTGNRGIFIQEAFDKAQRLASKKARRFGIEEIVNPKEVSARQSSAEKALKRLQKQAALREQARAAREARKA